jgi:putative selenate reductase FAD-binding subunit
MVARPSSYHRPKNLEEALRLLAEPDTVPLAGGTTLLAEKSSAAVVDLQDLGLDGIHLEDGQLRLGAMTRLVDLDDYLLAQDDAEDGDRPGSCMPLLRRAIRQAGPNTYRNAATIGGVVGARLPDSELLAALLALETEIALHEPGETTLTLQEYLGPDERPAGLITEILLPWEEGKGASERVARTPADYPIVSVTVWQPRGKVPRLAATGIDQRPVRLNAAEEKLGATLDDDSIEQATGAAALQVRHPGDFRGSAAYRSDMVVVLTRRVLRQAADASG